MRNDIYVPATVVASILCDYLKFPQGINPTSVTWITVGEYQISVCSDASLQGFNTDLTRTDIRIYKVSENKEEDALRNDVTGEFAIALDRLNADGTPATLTDSDDLFEIMKHARHLNETKQKNTVKTTQPKTKYFKEQLDSMEFTL